MARYLPYLFAWVLALSSATRCDAATAGAFEPAFKSQISGNATIAGIIVADDGAIYVSGTGLTNVEGVSPNLVRLRADGTIDPTFRASLSSVQGAPHAIAVDPQGRVVVSFTQVTSPTPGRPLQTWQLVRLLPTGQRDVFGRAPTIAGTTGSVTAIAFDEAGRILVTGTFDTLRAQKRSNIARLLDDGEPDPTFIASRPPSTRVLQRYDIASTGDGGVIVWAGQVIRYKGDGTVLSATEDHGYQRGFVDAQGRLVAANGNTIRRYVGNDNTLDSNFNYTTTDIIRAIAPGPDGTILVLADRGLVRLSATGAVDATFRPPTFDGNLTRFAIDPLGATYVAGAFRRWTSIRSFLRFAWPAASRR